MKTTKRLLSFVLVLAMLLTMASFPAFADESYTYTPKKIELEAASGNRKYAEPAFIARPSDYNIYVGDMLVLPEGGLATLRKPMTINAKYLSSAPNPTGLVIDVFQEIEGVNDKLHDETYNGATSTPADGINRFYIAIDYSASTNGTFTGIYPTAADMVAGTNKLEGITLDNAGTWAIGMAYAVYHDGTTDPKIYIYLDNTVDYGAGNNTHTASPYRATIEVKEAPTSAPVEVTAPAVPAGITASDISSAAGFVYDTIPTYPNRNTVNSIYARGFKVSDNKVVGENRQIIGQKYSGTLNGFSIDFTTPTYIESLTFAKSNWSGGICYVVYGSLDGVNWYKISNETKTNTTSNQHIIEVKGIAKYFNIDVKYFNNYYAGNWDGCSISAMTGKLNVLEGLAVTVEGDVTDSLTTDANGKVDFSTLLADYPAGEYIYKIGNKDVTASIADYVFTAATTVTVTKYVAPTGPVVTFVGNKGNVTSEADPDTGVYAIPEEYVGNYSFYKDANFKTKFDVTAKVEEDTTVYVKEFQWTHTAKTVELELKENATFGDDTNGPFAAPRETIYVGDTIKISHATYKDCVAGIRNHESTPVADADYITKINGYIKRFGTEADNAGQSTWISGADISYTFTTPGIYTVRFDSVQVMLTDGSTKQTFRPAGQNTSNFVFEVKEAPTTAPAAVTAPAYTGNAGEVVALLENNFDTSVAFRKAFGKDEGYTAGGDNANSVLALNVRAGRMNNTTSRPLVQSLYIQFNLPSLSYVQNIVLAATNSSTPTTYFYEYDVYGCADDSSDNWYLLGSGETTTDTYAVDGVAKRIRIVPRVTGTYAAVESYTVNGYAVETSAVDTNPNPTWLKDGVKVEIASEEDFPVAYESGDKNYAITGWKVDTGAGLNDISLAIINERNFKGLGNLVPVVTEIPVNADSLAATLTPAGDDATAGKTFDANRYINGFYVEGTQIRVAEGSGETEIKGGLRFVNILDNALVAELDELVTAGTVTSYEYGTLAMASTKYTGGDLVIGYNQYCKQVAGERLFARADSFEDKYFKYTVCVTGIEEVNYTKDVMVRPYLTINMEDGSSVTLYGEQYQTSLYAAAAFARDNDTTLTTDQQAEIASIIAAVEG